LRDFNNDNQYDFIINMSVVSERRFGLHTKTFSTTHLSITFFTSITLETINRELDNKSYFSGKCNIFINQFKNVVFFDTYVSIDPTTSDAQQKYLARGVRGV